MASSKKAVVIRRTREYLALAARNPEDHPVEVKRIAAFVPCARGLFYKTDDPEIAALMAEIEEARRRPPPPAPTAAPPSGHLAHMRQTDLEAEIDAALNQAVWAMQRFIGLQKRSSGAAEAPLAIHDLDTAIATLSRVRNELDPLVTEHQRRERDDPRLGGPAHGSAMVQARREQSYRGAT